MSFDVPGYEALRDALQLAYDRSARGKGRERHAQQRSGSDQPFIEQTICNVVVMLGEHAWDGQIIKKILEADRLDPEAGDRELADAMVYIAARLAVRRALRATAQDAITAKPPVILHTPVPADNTNEPTLVFPNHVFCTSPYCRTPTPHYHPIEPHPTLPNP